MTDEQIRALRKASAVLCGTGYHDEASAINCLLAASTASNGSVAAWMTEDGRVISAEQKAAAERDGRASASSVRPYSIPLRASTASDKQEAVALTDEQRSDLEWIMELAARSAHDGDVSIARMRTLLAAPPAQSAEQDRIDAERFRWLYRDGRAPTYGMPVEAIDMAIAKGASK